MKRRDLLTAAAGAMTGCAVSRSSTGAHDFDDLYGRLDRGLASVGNPFQEIAPEARFSASERAFVEAALRSLLLTSAVHELPEEERGDPRMISRLEAHRNDFELAMRSTRSMLEMSPAHRITLQRAIRTKPSLASKAADVLGRHAKLADVGAAERFELRRIAQQTAWRIQHQPLSMVADDTLDRMRRVEMRIAADSTQLR